LSNTYFSGVRASDATVAPPVIRVGDAGDIGIVVTAPDRDTAIVPLDRPWDIVGDFRKAEALGVGGTALANLTQIWSQFERTSGKISVVVVEESDDPDTQKAAVIGDATTKTGIHALLDSEATLGIKPDLILAPGFATANGGALADPVVGALASVGQKMRSIAFVDGPGTTTADAVAEMENYNQDNLVVCDPSFRSFDTVSDADVDFPLSTFAAGVTARTHLDPGKGWWWSFDNKEIAGPILGSSRPIDFRSYDAGSEATHLKGNRITTVVRKNGWRLWGGHTADAEALLGGTIVGRLVSWKVYEALEEAIFPFIGVPASFDNVPLIEGIGQKFIDDLVAKGALIRGSKLILPREINSAQQIADGRLFYRLYFQEAAPIRAVDIYGIRTPSLYAEFLDRNAATDAFAAAA